MWYDLRVGEVVLSRLGQDEMVQELRNVLEGGAEFVEVAVHGGLPVVKRGGSARKKRVKAGR